MSPNGPRVSLNSPRCILTVACVCLQKARVCLRTACECLRTACACLQKEPCVSPNGLQVSEHPAAARVSEQPVCLRTACVCLRTIYVRLRCSFHHFVYVFDRYNAVTRALTAGLTRSGTPWDAVVMPRGQEAAWRRPKSAVIGSCPVNSRGAHDPQRVL